MGIACFVLELPTSGFADAVGRRPVYLTAADNFGREIRLLVRPPGDRGTAAAETSAAEL